MKNTNTVKIKDKSGDNLILNLSFTYDISGCDASEFNNMYELTNVPSPMSIWGIGRTEDDENFTYSIIIMKKNNEILFMGSPEDLHKETGGDDEVSLFETIKNIFKIDKHFDEEYCFEIIDLIENLLSWVDPENAINYLNLEHEYTIGDYSIHSEDRVRCFVSRYIAGNDDFDVCGDISFDMINEINEGANYDVFAEYDTAIIIK